MTTMLLVPKHNSFDVKRVLLLIFLLANSTLTFSQQSLHLTPEGVLDNVFDSRGNAYNLSELLISNENVQENRSILVGCSQTTIFNLYFEPGCGMENTANSVHNARRAVLCKAFQDLSDFLTAPGAALLPSSTTKVNIWIRNINNVYTSPNGILGMASGYYCQPNSTTNGGIIDNEIWKTIHTGVDSYLNLTVPLSPLGGGSNQSGQFYHGMITFNFNDTASPPIPNTPNTISWNTNLNTATIPANQYDLYSVTIHEMTHALGFNTLINNDGSPRFGANYKYYSRYDSFLRSNGTKLLTTPDCPMYDNIFNVSTNILQPNLSDCGTIDTNCSSAIRFISTSVNVPVYTPNCFSDLSSLSHFEDKHYPICDSSSPFGNDNYFLMCNGLNNGVVRRYLKREERLALCDIGYKVKSTFGVSGAYINGTATSFNYSPDGICNGITVAGVNDGITNDGNYNFLYTIGDTAITISGNTILSNDIGATGGFTCLQDLTGSSTLSGTTGTTATNITFTSTLAGLHLLRYVPVTIDGQKGNITYIYVYVARSATVLTCNPTPTVCNLVSNGDFEQNVVLPTDLSQPIPGDNQFERACGWYRVGIGSPDYHFATSPSIRAQVPCNVAGYQEDRIANNRGYAGMFVTQIGTTSLCEIIGTTLSSSLQQGVQYQLSFDVSNGEFYRYRHIRFQAFISNLPPENVIGYVIPNSDLNSGVLLTNPTFSTTVNGWERITFTFTAPATSGLQYLYLGALNNTPFQVGGTPIVVSGCNQLQVTQSTNTSYYYIDNVSMIATGGSNFNLPTTICSNQTLTNLTTYLSAVPTDGYFSGTGVVLTNGVYSFNAATAGAGSHVLEYTYNNNLGCPVTLSDTITVSTALIILPSFNFVTTICSGGTAPILSTTSSNSVTGTWNPSVVSNTVSRDYIFTPNIGQCAQTVTVAITVNAFPVISSVTPATQTVCLNATPMPLQVNVVGTGLTYQWHSNTVNTNTGGTLLSGANTASYIPAVTVAGTRYYYVIVRRGSCQTTSSVLTVIVASGTVGTVTLSGTQTLCKTLRPNPTTVFTASVSGGTWSSSNTSIATITATTATTATIRVAPGTATIFYTVTSATGCTRTVSRTVTAVNPATPTFTQFPINPSTGQSDPLLVCSGSTPIALPTTSSNGYVGTWDPITMSTTVSQGYGFNPNLNQCATGIGYSVVVINANDFVANNDIFTLSYPTSTVTTNSILNNDTYLGSPLNFVPLNLSFTISPTGSLPTFVNGGATLNTNGTFTIQPNTTPGTYTFYYRLTTPCGITNTANVTLIINNFVSHPGKVTIEFCFTPGINQYSTQNLQPSRSLFDLATVGSLPATANNASIVASPPPGIVIAGDGTLTVTTTSFMFIEFYYKIRSNATGQLSNDIRCDIYVNSPIKIIPDTFYYNIIGLPTSGSTYNVLANDSRVVCTNNVSTPEPLALNSISLTGSATAPYSYFTILPNGFIAVDPDANPNGNGFIPSGTYTLTYQVCDLINPGICITQTVLIYVSGSAKMATVLPKQIKKEQRKTTTQSIYQIINFPDANLKAKLLEANDSNNIAYNLDNTTIVAVDSNADGEIDTDEALQIGRVNLSNANISNLTGMEYFTNLKVLRATNNYIVSYSTIISGLQILNLSQNPLENISVNNLPSLERLFIYNTQLNTLDVSNNYLLFNLGAYDTLINNLDLGANHSMIVLFCKNNPNLTSINIKNTSLLDYSIPEMQQDCWTNCPNLNNICADSNELATLQSFLSGCGVNTSGIDINSNCALGVDEVTTGRIAIYPNPSTGVFTIDLSQDIAVYTSVIVYDVLGKKVYSGVLTDTAINTINLSDLADGYYTAQLLGEAGSVSVKLIKQ